MIELVSEGPISNTRNRCYLIDSSDELSQLEVEFGNEAYCISNKTTYICDGSGVYVKKTGGGGSDVAVEELLVEENGVYTAEEGKAYSPVTVNVPLGAKLRQLISRSIVELTAEDLSPLYVIGDYAFYGCTSLQSVTIPEGTTSIRQVAFGNCSALRSISLPDTVSFIEGSVFMRCTNLESARLPSTLTSIPSRMFIGCSSLADIVLPSTITSIGSSVFDSCTSLTSIDLPENLESIGSEAFEGCTGLTSVVIPSNVSEIGQTAFKGCTSLISVTVEATSPPTLGRNGFYNTGANLVIYVPAASVDAYKAATNWSTYASQIQAIPTT